MTNVKSRDVVFAMGYRVWNDAQPYAPPAPMPPHRIARALVDDRSVDRAVIVDAYRSRLGRLKGRKKQASDFPASPHRVIVHPERWVRFDRGPRSIAIRTYRRLDRSLLRLATRAGLNRPVLITCHPVHAAVADRSEWADVVYYGWDDWLAYPVMADRRPVTQWAYRELAERDTCVIAVSQAILERIAAPRGHVIPNAMVARDFDDLPQVPEWFARIPGPVAFYAGALEDRVDAEAILAAARALPAWSFCLVGPMRNTEQFAALAEQPNVCINPPVPQPQVFAMATAADVCLIPHRKTAMSESMSPLKLYEYLATGSPVVATNLPPIRDVSDRVVLVEPGGDHAAGILAAARMAPIDTVDLRTWRAENDWGRRYLNFMDIALGRFAPKDGD